MIKARIDNGDYNVDMTFNSLDEYAGACKLAQRIRMEDWGDIYVTEFNPIQKEIDDIEQQIRDLQNRRKELIKQI